MSPEENKTIVRLYQEAYNKNNLDDLDELVAADLITHSLMPGLPPSLEGGKQIHRMTVAALPDLHVAIDDLLAEGDKVVMRFTATGTFKNEFLGLPPTGKPIKFTGISIFRLAGAKIVEHWGQEDELGLMRQLGALPPG
jgi:predicted ester cyclase